MRKVAGVMSSRFSFSIDSIIQGYHVFKDPCTDPDYDEELECVCEPYFKCGGCENEISGDTVIVGRVLDQYLQYVLYLFIRRSGVSHMHPADICGFFETSSLAFVTANGSTASLDGVWQLLIQSLW